MKKSDLIKTVATKTGDTMKNTEVMVDALLDAIVEAMANGETVQISGFGAFEVKERAAKLCRNPHTGEEVMVGAFKAPAFKASKVLKDRVK